MPDIFPLLGSAAMKLSAENHRLAPITAPVIDIAPVFRIISNFPSRVSQLPILECRESEDHTREIPVSIKIAKLLLGLSASEFVIGNLWKS